MQSAIARRSGGSGGLGKGPAASSTAVGSSRCRRRTSSTARLRAIRKSMRSREFARPSDSTVGATCHKRRDASCTIASRSSLVAKLRKLCRNGHSATARKSANASALPEAIAERWTSRSWLTAGSTNLDQDVRERYANSEKVLRGKLSVSNERQAILKIDRERSFASAVRRPKSQLQLHSATEIQDRADLLIRERSSGLTEIERKLHGQCVAADEYKAAVGDERSGLYNLRRRALGLLCLILVSRHLLASWQRRRRRWRVGEGSIGAACGRHCA
jgi:hypothetical protein